jgi:hypothetical protein
MAKKSRFTAKKFLEAWKAHGEPAKNWDAFVAKMRKASGDDHYPEERIAERIEQFTKDLKAYNYPVPKYPKKRVPAAVGAARALGWK